MIDSALRDLLAGVYDPDNWHDPSPRLVLADYLDEVGHPAAGCVRSHTNAARDDNQSRAALATAFGLPKRSYWDFGLPRNVDLPVAQVGAASEAFQRRAAQGWIGTLRLTGFNHQRAAAVRNATWLADVPRLAFHLDPRAEVPAAVPALPPWGNLVEFTARDNPTTSDDVVRLLAGRRSLRRLVLPGSPHLTDATPGLLAGLPELRLLDLSRTRLTRLVAEGPAFPRLLRLSLDQCDRCAEVRIRRLPRLREIDFPTDVEVVALDDLQELHRIDLISRSELRAFRAASVPRLSLLILRRCHRLGELTAGGLWPQCRVDLTACSSLPARSAEAVRRANPTADVETD
jgi:hypothetical protein